MMLLLLTLACQDAARDTSSADTGVGDTGSVHESGDSADTNCASDWYYDGDGDGFGLTEAAVSACTQPVG